MEEEGEPGEKLCDSDVSQSLNEMTVTTSAKYQLRGISFRFRMFMSGRLTHSCYSIEESPCLFLEVRCLSQGPPSAALFQTPRQQPLQALQVTD